MKIYCFLLFAVCSSLYGQEDFVIPESKIKTPDKKFYDVPIDDACLPFISRNYDKVTGKTTIAGSKPLLVSTDDKTGLSFIMMIINDPKTIIFNIGVFGASPCVDDNSTMNLLFTDNTRAEVTNDADFNCKGKYTLYFSPELGRMNLLAELSSKNIEIIRVHTSSGYVEQELSKEESDYIKNAMKCLYEYAF